MKNHSRIYLALTLGVAIPAAASVTPTAWDWAFGNGCPAAVDQLPACMGNDLADPKSCATQCMSCCNNATDPFVQWGTQGACDVVLGTATQNDPAVYAAAKDLFVTTLTQGIQVFGEDSQRQQAAGWATTISTLLQAGFSDESSLEGMLGEMRGLWAAEVKAASPITAGLIDQVIASPSRQQFWQNVLAQVQSSIGATGASVLLESLKIANALTGPCKAFTAAVKDGTQNVFYRPACRAQCTSTFGRLGPGPAGHPKYEPTDPGDPCDPGKRMDVPAGTDANGNGPTGTGPGPRLSGAGPGACANGGGPNGGPPGGGPNGGGPNGGGPNGNPPGGGPNGGGPNGNPPGGGPNGGGPNGKCERTWYNDCTPPGGPTGAASQCLLMTNDPLCYGKEF